MSRALELAAQARGCTRTNPLVGALIVKDNQVIAEGYHHYYGGDHAEVDAIKNATGSVRGATMFVTLEPCSHLGKTPPCAQAIIDAGISKVYAAMVDPNPEVAGRGIGMIKDAGIEVEVGFCEGEARDLNRAYLKYIATGTPYVTVKIAQTLDGKIADFRNYSKWITSENSRQRVHRLRSEMDAVMVGGNTVRVDNPSLTSHGVSDHDPQRIILSRGGNFDPALHLFSENNDQQTVLMTTADSTSLPAKVWKLPALENGRIDVKSILQRLGQEKVCTLLIEGGRELFSSFIAAGLVDRYVFVIAPRLLGGGTAAFEEEALRKLEDAVNLKTASVAQIGDDIWMEAFAK